MRFKKITAAFLVLCISVSLLISSAVGANLTTSDMADVLNEISILSGNGVDYALDSPLKRCEAAVFIVRILGKVDDVITNKEKYSKTNFIDVPSNSWYAHYVGFCSNEGIISGLQYNKFGPNDNTSEKAFLKMVLESLGYKYGIDYSWNNVYQVAYNAGLVTDISYKTRTLDNTSYKRSGVVSVLYKALKVKNKLTGRTLIQSLVELGAVDKNIAVSLGLITDTVATSISQVTPLNENKVSIRFSENVLTLSQDKIEIYETGDTSKKLTSKIVTQLNSELILETGSQTPDKPYSIALSNVTDSEGNISKLLTSNFIGYRNPELKSDFFRISKIEVVSKNVINLYYTHPIIPNVAENARFYYIEQNGSTIISGNSQSISIKALKSSSYGVSILLKETSLSEGVDYKLKVSGDLTSEYGVKLNNELGDSIPFKGKGIDNPALKIASVDALSSNRISAEFNMEVDPGFAEKFLNYSVIGPNNSTIAVSNAVIGGEGSKKGKTVILSLMSSIDRTKQYELKIEYLPDIFRQSVIEGAKQAFSGAYPGKTDLSVVFAMALDKGTVQLYFNKPLDPTAAAIPAYYLISGVNTSFNAVPSKVLYSESGKDYKALLYLPSDKYLSSSNTYKIRVLSSTPDYYGNTSTTNGEFNFQGSGSDILKPAFSKAVIISNDTIKVEFNKEIANDIVNIQSSNYWLEYSNGTSTLTTNPLFVKFIDGTNMVLKFDSLRQDVKYILKFSALKDFTGNITSNSSDGNNSIEVVLGK